MWTICTVKRHTAVRVIMKSQLVWATLSNAIDVHSNLLESRARIPAQP